MKYFKTHLLIIAMLSISTADDIHAQKLTIDETIDYLTDLVNSSTNYQGSLNQFTFIDKKIKYTRVISGKSICTTSLLFDIRKLTNITSEKFVNLNKDTVYQVNFIFSSESLHYSTDCTNFNGFADNWGFGFRDNRSSTKFKKAILYLKKKIMEAYPTQKDPFDN